MAGVIGQAMEELAQRDENLAVLTADLSSYAGLGKFAKDYPDKYYNVGIAEQNMIGVACGMAAEGLNAFAMSYAAFAVNRCFDQMRCGMGYMGLPVKLIGMASGYSIGILGATHMECNDVALMGTIPDMTIVCPADATETVKAIQALASYDHPAYLRLTGPTPCPPVYKEDFNFKIGKANWVIQNGADVVVVASGSVVHEAVRGAKELRERGVGSSVVDMHTITPFDAQLINEIISGGFGLVVTLEEHVVAGGLGEKMTHELHRGGYTGKLLTLGTSPRFEHPASYSSLLAKNGLEGPSVASAVLNKLGASIE